MGAFDGELYLLGFRSPAPVKPKKKKITHNFYGPLTCYIARVSRGGSCSTDGYIIGISKKKISHRQTPMKNGLTPLKHRPISIATLVDIKITMSALLLIVNRFKKYIKISRSTENHTLL